MKENREVKNELNDEQLQQNVQIAIELRSLLLRYKGDFSRLLVR